MNPFAALDESDILKPSIKNHNNNNNKKKSNNSIPKSTESQSKDDGFTVVKKLPRKPKPPVVEDKANISLTITEQDLQQHFAAQPLKNYQLLTTIFSLQEVYHRNALLGTIAMVCKCWYIAVNSTLVWKPKALQKGYGTVESKQSIQARSALDQGKLWRKLYIEGYLEERRKERRKDLDDKNASGDEFEHYRDPGAKKRKGRRHYRK